MKKNKVIEYSDETSLAEINRAKTETNFDAHDPFFINLKLQIFDKNMWIWQWMRFSRIPVDFQDTIFNCRQKIREYGKDVNETHI